MAIVIEGTLVGAVEENHYETSRGPQTDHVIKVLQDGENADYPLRAIVSYKIVDEAKKIKVGARVRIPLFVEVKPKGKNGPWVQWVALGVTEMNLG